MKNEGDVCREVERMTLSFITPRCLIMCPSMPIPEAQVETTPSGLADSPRPNPRISWIVFYLYTRHPLSVNFPVLANVKSMNFSPPYTNSTRKCFMGMGIL